jgi:hypothetical protein
MIEDHNPTNGNNDNNSNRITLSIEEFFPIATLEQKELLSDIYDNVQKEVAITKKINEIYGSIDDGIYFSDGGVTILESKDDADAISLGLKTDLKDVRSNIGELLKKAVNELHMEDVGMIQRQYSNYVEE